MANLNHIVLVGLVAADPESRSTMEGLAMTKFRLATNRPQGGSDFFDIVCWRELAENSAKVLRKGKMILVDGRIQIRSFEDQTGKKNWATEIVAHNVQVLEAVTPKAQTAAVAAPIADEERVDDSDLAGDLPF